METNGECVACRHNSFRVRFNKVTDYLYRTPGTWSLVECEHCQSLQIRPTPTLEDIKGFYQSYFTHAVPQALIGEKSDRARVLVARILKLAFEERGFLGRFARITLHIVAPRAARTVARSYAFMHPGCKPLDVIDYGCGGGELISRLAKLGHCTLGLDFDDKALVACRSRGLKVETANELWKLESSRFDIVTCMNVIEHVPDPGALLQQLKKLLKPNGVLLIETPNAKSLLARRLGPLWRGLETPRHLNIFSTKGLTTLLDVNGFSIQRERFVPCADFMARSSDISKPTKQILRLISPLIDLLEWLNPSWREVHFLELKPKL